MLLRLFPLGLLVASGFATAAPMQKLSQNECKPVGESLIRQLPEAWIPYLAHTKACPLAKRGGKAAVTLVSIFTIEYYEKQPDSAPWENFPRPLLLDRQGKCLGQLAELYPDEQPRELILHYGKWQGALPGLIQVQVKDPTPGGDYRLPDLNWNARQGKYLVADTIDPDLKEKMQCPMISKSQSAN
ncbi:hypothetical protein [Parachitinimonas caeni]|uniref:Uncharacterized protein n=1 Tax=Parachitinimonas caeni TaxID=3031301 RepID=A0ABT7E0C9_9NEIS|nr:hypothetical protein [Parachitinimonas caeni]MDK2125763.1 hypothetical protein [Parachitinimonas caeni]